MRSGTGKTSIRIAPTMGCADRFEGPRFREGSPYGSVNQDFTPRMILWLTYLVAGFQISFVQIIFHSLMLPECGGAYIVSAATTCAAVVVLSAIGMTLAFRAAQEGRHWTDPGDAPLYGMASAILALAMHAILTFVFGVGIPISALGGVAILTATGVYCVLRRRFLSRPESQRIDVQRWRQRRLRWPRGWHGSD